MKLVFENTKIAVIGQGYVGLPLALEFSKYFRVLGYDTNKQRVRELNNGSDSTNEADLILLQDRLNDAGNQLTYTGYTSTCNLADIGDCNVFIITVPTPIDEYNAPDLRFIQLASKAVASVLKPGDLVIYESTVYPGCTEDECVPILEIESGLKLNVDFTVGYSPERIVPGDKVNTLVNIVKVTSGSNQDSASFVDELYKVIIKAGTFKASSIKVAEASKAIENAQRDVNISFVNELALIFDRVGIDTAEVLEAASTKFNFLSYKPGLVGGHCISVDPYYLAHKATQLGYHPQVILSGRRVNDFMPEFIVSKIIKLLIKKNISINNSKALILGVTFKENCPDVRNTKVINIVRELQQFNIKVDCYDPWADKTEVKNEFGLSLLSELPIEQKYEIIILAVAHSQFYSIKLHELKGDKAVVFDIKSFFPKCEVDGRL